MKETFLKIMYAVKFAIMLPFAIIGLGLIYFYKLCISPLLPKVCRYYPSCSSYAAHAVKSFGLFVGTWIAAKRLLRCRGKHKGGCDYLPPNVRKEFFWFS